MKKRLIINADDYGWDKDADEGILKLCQHNCITSTTILATHVSEKALTDIKAYPNVSKGLHINLIDGKPLTSGLKTIVDSHGNFLSAQKLLSRVILGKVDKMEIEVEIIAQLYKLRNSGIQLSHADSHRHIHLYPVIGKIILSILLQNDIQKIRVINQNRIDDLRRLIIKLFSMYPNGEKRKFQKPELLLCDFSMENTIEDKLFLSSIKDAFSRHSTIELMTHPAMENRLGSYLNRKSEFEYLQSGTWKELLKVNSIELISYNDL